jgi:hypothetical protein
MSYYTTGASFSLKTGTHLPRIIYNNNGITSSRTSGVIAPSDPQTNGPASTSVFMEVSNDSNGTLNAERLAEEFADKIEPHYSSVSFISQSYLLNSILLQNIQISQNLNDPFFIRIASYSGGYIASDASSFYINTVTKGPSNKVIKVGPTTGSPQPVINSIDCLDDGTKIIGINYETKQMYISTDSGKTFTTYNIGTGNYIQVRLARNGSYFTLLNANHEIYIYDINNIPNPYIFGDSTRNIKCSCMSSDGSKQFLFFSSGFPRIINMDTALVGKGNPYIFASDTWLGNVVLSWDSCACSSDVNASKQIAVAFVNTSTSPNPASYECYIYVTANAWGGNTYTRKLITRRVASGNNYAQERAAATTSFMSSNGSKKWCIIDDQLYYNNTDDANNFVLVPNPDGYFISYGTCSPDGSIVYLIKQDGSLWKSIDNGTTLTSL